MGGVCSNNAQADFADDARPSSIHMVICAKCCRTATMKASRNGQAIRISNHHLPRAGTLPEAKAEPQVKKAMRAYHSEEITTISESSPSRPNYHFLRERLLKWTPSSHHCRLFCGGPSCKYCDSNGFPPALQAIPGLYSTWVTEAILASARPTAAKIMRFDLFSAFKEQNIKSVINLQRPYEHANCGPPFPPRLEFAYDPEEFMKHKFYHYNFGWPDFGASTVACLLDMVKVLAFALTQGKVAIHCHAGLGRTGVLICAFLMWDKNYTPTEAIQLVRNIRPGSVQTTPQVDLLFEFDDFLKTLRPIFDSNLTFEQHLKRQQLILHGVERRLLKHIPKIVFVCCERLLELVEVKESGTLKDRLRRMIRNENLEGQTDGNGLGPELWMTVGPTNRPIATIPQLVTDLERPEEAVLQQRPTIQEQGSLQTVAKSSFVVKKFDGKESNASKKGEAKEALRLGLESVDTAEGYDMGNLLATFETFFKCQGPGNDEICKLKSGLTTKSFTSRWDALIEETSVENILYLLHDWFMSLKEAAFSPESGFPHSNGNVQPIPKVIKHTLLYCSSIFSRISTRGDSQVKALCASYLKQCFTKKSDVTAASDSWFLATVECINEMSTIGR